MSRRFKKRRGFRKKPTQKLMVKRLAKKVNGLWNGTKSFLSIFDSSETINTVVGVANTTTLSANGASADLTNLFASSANEGERIGKRVNIYKLSLDYGIVPLSNDTVGASRPSYQVRVMLISAHNLMGNPGNPTATTQLTWADIFDSSATMGTADLFNYVTPIQRKNIVVHYDKIHTLGCVVGVTNFYSAGGGLPAGAHGKIRLSVPKSCQEVEYNSDLAGSTTVARNGIYLLYFGNRNNNSTPPAFYFNTMLHYIP